MVNKRHQRTFLVALFCLSVAVFALNVAMAHPFRGSVRWSVLLCRYQDGGTPPRTPDFYRNMLLTRGTGGLADYWGAVSYGGVNLDGSDVQGWYVVPMTTQQARDIAGGGPSGQRGKLQQDCLDAAQNDRTSSYTVPDGNRVLFVTFPDIDLFGGGNRAFVPFNIDIGGVGHEGGHGLGLNHSFSDDPVYRNADWAQIGEYDDPWDVMSYGNVFGTPTASYGFGGPGLNAYHVDRMGWLPRHRVMTLGADGQGNRTVTLAALNHPEASGPMLVRIPFDPADPFHYYTVEFRKNDGWDTGLPQPIVLIHEVRARGDAGSFTHLLRERGGARNPVQALNANGVRISVASTSPGTNQATVAISSDIVERCLQGFVWREAGPNDRVCVTGQVRDQTRQDNSLAASRRNPAGGPFGPDTCLQGFVWREAFPGDHVCVTGATRAQAVADNAQVVSRRNPARSVFGPNTCRQGFVWREADASDYVCVTGQVRDQTRQDNSLAASRRNPAGGPFGPDTCLQGFVWREAFPGDHVCVTGATRAQAVTDNREAANRVARP